MKFLELYEHAAVVKLSNGEIVKLIQLTDKEKEKRKKIYDLANELKVPAYIKVGGRRSNFRYILHPMIKDKLDNEND